MFQDLWQQCLETLKDELPSQQYNTWVRPLRLDLETESHIVLLAPNRFVKDWVADKFVTRFQDVVERLSGESAPLIEIGIAGSVSSPVTRTRPDVARAKPMRVE